VSILVAAVTPVTVQFRPDIEGRRRMARDAVDGSDGAHNAKVDGCLRG